MPSAQVEEPRNRTESQSPSWQNFAEEHEHASSLKLEVVTAQQRHVPEPQFREHVQSAELQENAKGPDLQVNAEIENIGDLEKHEPTTEPQSVAEVQEHAQDAAAPQEENADENTEDTDADENAKPEEAQVKRKYQIFAQRIQDMVYPYGFILNDGNETTCFGLLVKANGRFAYILTRYGMVQFKALGEIDESLRGVWVKCDLLRNELRITNIVEVVLPPVQTRLLSKLNNRRRIWVYDYITMTSRKSAFSDFLGPIDIPEAVETYDLEENRRFSAEYLVVVPEGITCRYQARVLKIHGAVEHQSELPEEMLSCEVASVIRYSRSPSYFILQAKPLLLTPEQLEKMERKQQAHEYERYYKKLLKDTPHLVVGPVLSDAEKESDAEDEQSDSETCQMK